MDEDLPSIQLVKEVPKVLPMIYKDCAQPAVIKIGKALETVFDLSNTILLPLKLINQKANLLFRRHMDRYKEKLEKIDEDKIVDVSTIIGTPIIDRMTYISSDEIADLFLNILAKASSIDTMNSAHPAFVHIIDRMTVDEARLIKFLEGRNFVPFVNIILNTRDSEAYQKLAWNLTGLEFELDFIAKENIDTYLDNLASVKVIESQGSISKADPKVYTTLKEQYGELLKSFNEYAQGLDGYNDECTFTFGFYSITELGLSFIKACNAS